MAMLDADESLLEVVVVIVDATRNEKPIFDGFCGSRQLGLAIRVMVAIRAYGGILIECLMEYTG